MTVRLPTTLAGGFGRCCGDRGPDPPVRLAGGRGDWFEESPCGGGADDEEPFLAVVLVLGVADRVLERVGDVGVADVVFTCRVGDPHLQRSPLRVWLSRFPLQGGYRQENGWGEGVWTYVASANVVVFAGCVGWPSSDRCASVPPAGLECPCGSSATLDHVRGRDQFGGDSAGLFRCQAWPELGVVTDLVPVVSLVFMCRSSSGDRSAVASIGAGGPGFVCGGWVTRHPGVGDGGLRCADQVDDVRERVRRDRSLWSPVMTLSALLPGAGSKPSCKAMSSCW